MPAYRDKQQWRWRCRVRLPRSGTTVRLSGTPTQNTKRAAEQDERVAIARAIEHDIHPALAIPPAPTLADFAPTFVDWCAGNCAGTTATNRARAMVCLCGPLGSLRLDEIDAAAIERYRAHARAQGFAPSSINAHTSTLRKALALARELGQLHTQHTAIRALKIADGEAYYLPPPELERVFAASAGDHEHAAMVRTAARCGLRRGELLGLRPRDIDAAHAQLHVRQQVINGEIRPPKGGRVRTIPLLPDVAAALAKLDMSGALVWPGRGGLGALSIETVRSRLRATFSAAGISSPGQRIGWHTLRHTFASHLVQRGCPLQVVQVLLGHSQITTTMRYAHLAPTSAAQWIQVLAKDWPNSAVSNGSIRHEPASDGKSDDVSNCENDGVIPTNTRNRLTNR